MANWMYVHYVNAPVMHVSISTALELLIPHVIHSFVHLKIVLCFWIDVQGPFIIENLFQRNKNLIMLFSQIS